MEKFPAPGKPSSPIDFETATGRLSAFIDSELLKPLENSLGSDGELYLVGGTVRDILSGKQETDLDLATVLLPEEVCNRLARNNIRVIKTGLEHGTVTAVVNKSNIEITTYRQPSSRLESRFSDTIEQDLAGRDFTINAIGFSFNKRQFIDPFGGISDLESGVLRAVGDPFDRFSEDPLRILRAVRFGQAEGRSIEHNTWQNAKSCSALLARVSIERIRDEFSKILICSSADAALKSLQELQFYSMFIPQVLPAIGFEQNRFHVEDVFFHTLTVVQKSKPELPVRLAAFFHDLGKPPSLSVDEKGERHFYKHEHISESISKEVMKRLRYSNDLTKEVSTIVKLHMRPIECGPAGVRRLLRDLGSWFDNWRELKIADASPTLSEDEFMHRLSNFDNMVQLELEKASINNTSILAINGDDLIELGFSPGKKIGEVLKGLQEAVIEEPELNNRQVLLKMAKAMLG
jgi:tRNA nucleotidyltransferase (CCA-adding enzyme)